MNREIKFRAWNGMEMKYDVIVGRFGAFYVNPGTRGDGLDDNDRACLTPSNTIYSSQVPIMQFTGLKDKNGIEIYDGDIIYHSYFKDKGVMEWYEKRTAFCLRWIEPTGYQEMWPVDSQSFEVIGNIYENPELLAPVKEKENL